VCASNQNQAKERGARAALNKAARSCMPSASGDMFCRSFGIACSRLHAAHSNAVECEHEFCSRPFSALYLSMLSSAQRVGLAKTNYHKVVSLHTNVFEGNQRCDESHFKFVVREIDPRDPSRVSRSRSKNTFMWQRFFT